MRRYLLFVTALTTLVAASAALASGGTSIRAAPLVRPGIVQTTNTSTDPTADGNIGSEVSLGCWHSLQYWRLQLKAGDQASFSGKMGIGAYEFEMAVFPSGTTDANIDKATALVTKLVTAKPMSLKAAKTGTYVVVAGPDCYHGENGAFSFTVTVKRART